MYRLRSLAAQNNSTAANAVRPGVESARAGLHQGVYNSLMSAAARF